MKVKVYVEGGGAGLGRGCGGGAGRGSLKEFDSLRESEFCIIIMGIDGGMMMGEPVKAAE